MQRTQNAEKRPSVRPGYTKHTWYPSRLSAQWIYDTWYSLMREGTRVDVSSVVRAILRIAEEDAAQNPQLIREWAQAGIVEERHEPVRISALVETGRDAIVWDVRATMSREFGSSRKLSDALEPIIRYVRQLASTPNGRERLYQAIIAATPAEDGRGRRRILQHV